jgi:uncharacterized phage protein (TIGR02220 family)
MELLFKDLKKILDDGITVYQRGLLFTIVVCREGDSPKLTYAKFKACVNMKEANPSLELLHKKGYIKWSGFAAYENGLKKIKTNPHIVEVIEFMNNLYDRKFNPHSEASVKNLRNRLDEHSVEDIKKVVANRYAEWKDDEMMSKHLTPHTIFRPSKFDKYLEEAKRTHQGESLVLIDKLNISHGDELLPTMIDSLVGNDIYSIKTYETDNYGRYLDKGQVSKMYGVDLKKLLRIQKDRKERGLIKETVYKYQKS